MEIVKVRLARATWLFDTQELNPRGLKLYPDVFGAFSKRYQFAVLPTAEEIRSGGSLYFRQGKFFFEPSGENAEVEFELHSDGLVASTRHSTEASDAFLQDSVIWFGEQLGAAYPLTLTKKRVYRDELVVSMSVSMNMNMIVTRLERLSVMLSSLSNKSTEIIGLRFGSEGGSSTLVVERREGSPFDENRYYSAAALPTLQHIEALNLFEQLLAE